MQRSHNVFKQKKLAFIIAALLPLSANADVKYDELKAQVEALQNQLNQVQLVLKQKTETLNSMSKIFGVFCPI